MNVDEQKNQRGIVRVWKALFNSLDGFKTAWSTEAAFRQEFVLFIILLPMAFLFPVGLPSKLAMIASLFIVLITELLNSAVEAVVDLVTEDYHPLAKKAKDIASAAVLSSLVLVVVIWAMALYPWVRSLLPVAG